MFSLDFVPNSPVSLDKPCWVEEGVGLKAKGLDFVDGVSVDMALVSGEARRALAFGLKMSPHEPEIDAPENTGPMESDAEDIGVKSGA